MTELALDFWSACGVPRAACDDSHEIIYATTGAVLRAGIMWTLDPSQGTVGNLGVAHFERLSNGFRMVFCYRSIPVRAVFAIGIFGAFVSRQA
jgi:hypothetical protein